MCNYLFSYSHESVIKPSPRFTQVMDFYGIKVRYENHFSNNSFVSIQEGAIDVNTVDVRC